MTASASSILRFSSLCTANKLACLEKSVRVDAGTAAVYHCSRSRPVNYRQNGSSLATGSYSQQARSRGRHRTSDRARVRSVAPLPCMPNNRVLAVHVSIIMYLSYLVLVVWQAFEQRAAIKMPRLREICACSRARRTFHRSEIQHDHCVQRTLMQSLPLAVVGCVHMFSDQRVSVLARVPELLDSSTGQKILQVARARH